MDVPGRVNNLYKEKLIVEPTVEVTRVDEEISQGCKFARASGYGTLEFCSMPSDDVPVPPRLFQLDENVNTARIVHKNQGLGIISRNADLFQIILGFLFLIILWRALRR